MGMSAVLGDPVRRYDGISCARGAGAV